MPKPPALVLSPLLAALSSMDINEIINQSQIEQLNNGDIVKAEKLLLKAVESGSGHAAHELGVLYILVVKV